MKVSIIPAQSGHVALIKDQLRPESVRETQMIGPENGSAIMAVLLTSDHAWSGFVDGEIACMWGLAPMTLLSKSATLWLITTPLVEKHSFLFLRWNQRFMEDLRKQDQYSLINGCVRKDFARSVWWLKWLGFKLNPPSSDGLMYFHWEKPL